MMVENLPALSSSMEQYESLLLYRVLCTGLHQPFRARSFDLKLTISQKENDPNAAYHSEMHTVQSHYCMQSRI